VGWRQKEAASKRYRPDAPPGASAGDPPRRGSRSKIGGTERRIFSRLSSVIGSTDHGRFPFPPMGMANRPEGGTYHLSEETRRASDRDTVEEPSKGSDASPKAQMLKHAQVISGVVGCARPGEEEGAKRVFIGPITRRAPRAPERLST
jgi:hypothetical protein